MSDDYNGWTNHPTWCVNLWLSNEQSLYNDVNDILSNEQSIYSAILALSDYVQEIAEMTCPGVVEGASFVTDLFGSVLSDVDYHEIVTNWVEDLDGFTIDDDEIVEVAE